MSNMHARLMTAFVAGAFLIGVASFVQAESDDGMHYEGMYQGSHASSHHDAHHFVDQTFHSLFRHAKDLGLSEEQITKLKTQRVAHEKTRIRGGSDMQLAEIDVMTLAHDEKAKMSDIENAVRKSEMAHANLRIEAIKTLREAFAVLTPEQRDKWRSHPAMKHGEDTCKSDYDGHAHNGKPGAPKEGMR
jgi:periplasmic protein CpxP/Spy